MSDWFHKPTMRWLVQRSLLDCLPWAMPSCRAKGKRPLDIVSGLVSDGIKGGGAINEAVGDKDAVMFPEVAAACC